jgi:hypothetical protein
VGRRQQNFKVSKEWEVTSGSRTADRYRVHVQRLEVLGKLPADGIHGWLAGRRAAAEAQLSVRPHPSCAPWVGQPLHWRDPRSLLQLHLRRETAGCGDGVLQRMTFA